MAQGDVPVRISTQGLTHAETLAAGVVGGIWYVQGLPRYWIYLNQTDAGAPMSVSIDVALRDSAVAGVPDFHTLGAAQVLVPGGAAPVLLNLAMGVAYIRFTANGGPGNSVDVLASAFV